MVGVQGNATKEEGEEQLLKDVRARIASSHAGNPVTLTTTEARALYEMAGGSFEAEEEDPQDPKEKVSVGAPGQYPEPHAPPSPAAQEAARAGRGLLPGEGGGVDTIPPGGSTGTGGAAGQSSGGHGAQSSGGKLTRAQLNEMTKEELVEYADDHDIEVAQSWTKAEIVDAIAKHKG